jgi:hypothetical protein
MHSLKLNSILFIIGLSITVSMMAALLSSISHAGIWPWYYFSRGILLGLSTMAGSLWMMTRSN